MQSIRQYSAYDEYRERMSSFKMLNNDEMTDIFVRMRDSRCCKEDREKMREQLITSNWRLVLAFIPPHYKRYDCILDIISEGNCGLMVAVDRYDVSLGYTFATYAKHWISKHINRYICRKELVHIGLNRFANISSEKVRRNRDGMDSGDRRLNFEYLGSFCGGEDGLADRFERMAGRDDVEKNVGDKDFVESIGGIVRKTLKQFGDRDRKIFVRYYGFDGSTESPTSRVLGKRMKVSAQTVFNVLEKVQRALVVEMRRSGMFVDLGLLGIIDRTE